MKQKILGPYKVVNREGGKLEVVELVGDQEISLRPAKIYDYVSQRQSAYGLMKRLNQRWQAELTDEDLAMS